MTKLLDHRQLKQLVDARQAHEGASSYDEVLDEVSARITKMGSAGKLEIGALVTWKRLRASTTWAKDLMNTPDSVVRSATAKALIAARDTSLDLVESARRARTELLALPGCKHGPALASAILLASARDRMAIYDSRAQRGLDRMYLPIDASGGLYTGYMSVIVALLFEINDGGLVDRLWIPRDVDLAFFTVGAPG